MTVNTLATSALNKNTYFTFVGEIKEESFSKKLQYQRFSKARF